VESRAATLPRAAVSIPDAEPLFVNRLSVARIPDTPSLSTKYEAAESMATTTTLADFFDINTSQPLFYGPPNFSRRAESLSGTREGAPDSDNARERIRYNRC
jgi:hypothetical protein